MAACLAAAVAVHSDSAVVVVEAVVTQSLQIHEDLFPPEINYSVIKKSYTIESANLLTKIHSCGTDKNCLENLIIIMF